MDEERVAVVTGATSGIGRWIALGLARAGMHVVLVARNQARGEATRGWIAQQAPAARTSLELADLSLLSQTRDLAARLAAAHPRIALLVNNAGLFSAHRTLTAEGHELTLAVNHLAPFVLTRALLVPLRDASGARVVNIGSTASDRARIDPDDLESARRWGLMRAYGQSKLAIMMTTFEWARRLEGSGTVVHVVHPGVVATSIGNIPGPVGLFWKLGAPFMLTSAQGAETPLFVALDPAAGRVTGRYWKRRAEARPNRLALDPALVARVWAATERLAGPA
jgi:NAD(P)-dependent dehydrogenase (short-subunit alcohol dehydrogenase family)